MADQYAYKMNISPDEADALQQEILSALNNSGIQAPAGPLVSADAPPEGAFGFADGVGGFLLSAWKELTKVPGAVKSLADGVKNWLSQRPNGTVTLECPNGKKLSVRANMNGEDIAKILESGCD
ncbi:MAG: hypothetical protein HUU60_05000 [Armatimonadetes bacterium]|nr:hypothetical protein [Armatimonadota bacterium]